MKILQEPISDNHLNAMFFDGVVAEHIVDGKRYTLETFQTGEILYTTDFTTYQGDYLSGVQIVELGKQGLINDNDLDDSNSDKVVIIVDKFFAIYCDGKLNDDDIGDSDYREALKWFRDELKILDITFCHHTGLLFINEVAFSKERILMVIDLLSNDVKLNGQFMYEITITDRFNSSTVTINKNNINDLTDALASYKRFASDVDFI